MSTSTSTINTTFAQRSVMTIPVDNMSNVPVDNAKTKTGNAATCLDIEDLHQLALSKGASTYEDPETKFTVYTELLHLKRGYCCGNGCRHCPYGWVNVGDDRRRALQSSGIVYAKQKCESGNEEQTHQLVQHILEEAEKINPKNPNGTSNLKSAKNVPFTKRGDKGTSQLGTGEHRSKDDVIFEALGTVDELCSVIGVVHAHVSESSKECDFGHLEERLLDVMSRLLDIGSFIAKPDQPTPLDPSFTTQLEDWISEMTEDMPELTSFIVPTGSVASAQCHVARTVCRRAERRIVPLVVSLNACDPTVMKYINRLSDFLFTAARFMNYCQGRDEIQYQRRIQTNRKDETNSNQNAGQDNGNNNNNNMAISSSSSTASSLPTHRQRVSRPMQQQRNKTIQEENANTKTVG